VKAAKEDDIEKYRSRRERGKKQKQESKDIMYKNIE
jgi:hypothetical protein